MIKAVIFDIDDTLYSFRKAHKTAMESLDVYAEECLKVDKQVFRSVLKKTQDEILERLGCNNSAIHNRLIRYQNALAILDRPIHPHAREMSRIYWDTLIRFAVPEPGIQKLMRELKERGIYIGIGTDMTAYLQVKKLEKLGLAQYVDSMVTSEEAGVEKPEKELFRLCIDKAGCLPGECVFIGDNPKKDIAGARSVGMHALCYQGCTRSPEAEPEICFESYEDRGIFERLGIYEH